MASTHTTPTLSPHRGPLPLLRLDGGGGGGGPAPPPEPHRALSDIIAVRPSQLAAMQPGRAAVVAAVAPPSIAAVVMQKEKGKQQKKKKKKKKKKVVERAYSDPAEADIVTDADGKRWAHTPSGKAFLRPAATGGGWTKAKADNVPENVKVELQHKRDERIRAAAAAAGEERLAKAAELEQARERQEEMKEQFEKEIEERLGDFLDKHRHVAPGDARRTIRRRLEQERAAAAKEADPALRKVMLKWRNRLLRLSEPAEAWLRESKGMRRRASDPAKPGHYRTPMRRRLPGDQGGRESYVFEAVLDGKRYLRRADGHYFTKADVEGEDEGEDLGWQAIDKGAVPMDVRVDLTTQELRASILPALRFGLYATASAVVEETPVAELTRQTFAPQMYARPKNADEAVGKKEMLVWRTLMFLAKSMKGKRELILDYLEQHGIADPTDWRPCPHWARVHWPQMRRLLDVPWLFPTERGLVTGAEEGMRRIGRAKAREVEWETLKPLLAKTKAERGDEALSVPAHVAPFVTYMLFVRPVETGRRLLPAWPDQDEADRRLAVMVSPTAQDYYMMAYAAVQFGINELRLRGLKEWHDENRINYMADNWGWSDPQSDAVEFSIHTIPAVRVLLDTQDRIRKAIKGRLAAARRKRNEARHRRRGADESDVSEDSAAEDADEKEDDSAAEQRRRRRLSAFGVDENAGRRPVSRFDREKRRRERKKERERRKTAVERVNIQSERQNAQGGMDGLGLQLGEATGKAEAVEADNVIEGIHMDDGDGDPIPDDAAHESEAQVRQLDIIAHEKEGADAAKQADEAKGKAEAEIDAGEKKRNAGDDGVEPVEWYTPGSNMQLLSGAQARLRDEYSGADPPPFKNLFHDVGTGKTFSSQIVAAALCAHHGVTRVYILCPVDVRPEFVKTIGDRYLGDVRLHPYFNTTGKRFAVTGPARELSKPKRYEINMAEVDGGEARVTVVVMGYSVAGKVISYNRHTWWGKRRDQRERSVLIIDEVHTYRNWLNHYHENSVAGNRRPRRSTALETLINVCMLLRPSYVIGMSGTVAYDNATNVPAVIAWLAIAATAHFDETHRPSVTAVEPLDEDNGGDEDEEGNSAQLEDALDFAGVSRAKIKTRLRELNSYTDTSNVIRTRYRHSYNTPFMAAVMRASSVVRELFLHRLTDAESFLHAYFTTNCTNANTCNRFDLTQGAASRLATRQVSPNYCPNWHNLAELVEWLRGKRYVDWQPRTDTRKLDNGTVERVFPREKVFYTAVPMTPKQDKTYRDTAANIELGIADAELSEVVADESKTTSLNTARMGMNVHGRTSVKAKVIVNALSQPNADVPAIVFSNFIRSGANQVVRVFLESGDAWQPLILTPRQQAFMRLSENAVPGRLDNEPMFAEFRDSAARRFVFFVDGEPDRTFATAQRSAFNELRPLMKAQKALLLRLMNHPDNRHGKYLRAFVITPKSGTGVDFKNVRSVHIMEPTFNDSALVQVRGRGARRESHRYLPDADRTVNHRVYVSVHLRRCLEREEESGRCISYESAKDVPASIDERLLRLSRVKLNEICAMNAVLMNASPSCDVARGDFTVTTAMACVSRSRDKVLMRDSACEFCQPMNIQYKRAPGFLAWVENDKRFGSGQISDLSVQWTPLAEDAGSREVIDDADDAIEAEEEVGIDGADGFIDDDELSSGDDDYNGGDNDGGGAKRRSRRGAAAAPAEASDLSDESDSDDDDY